MAQQNTGNQSLLSKARDFFSWRRWDATQDSVGRNAVVVVPAATDAKKEFTSGDRKTLLRLARYLRDNLGVTAGIITEMSRYSVGSNVMLQAQTTDENWNEQAEEYFRGWSESADITGRYSFGQLVDLWCQAMVGEGEVFAVKANVQDEIKLQTILSHAIDWKSDDYTDGIRYDSFGRPTRYRMASGRTLNAAAVRHIMEPRPNRLRGVPGIAHAANNLFDLRDILSFEKQGVKLNSAIAAVVKRANSSNSSGNRFLGHANKFVQEDTILTLEQVLGGAQIPQIGLQDDVKIHQSDKTSPTFQGFLEWLIRDMAVGFGMPYEFVWSAEKLQGTAQRFIMSKAQRRFEQIQTTFEPHITDIYRTVISRAIEAGQLPFNQQWGRCEWIWPKAATVDFGRESREERENIKAGIKSLKEHFAELQKDWRTEMRQIASEKAELAEMGLSVFENNGIDNLDTEDLED